MAELRNLGINPYPAEAFDVTANAKDIKENLEFKNMLSRTWQNSIPSNIGCLALAVNLLGVFNLDNLDLIARSC